MTATKSRQDRKMGWCARPESDCPRPLHVCLYDGAGNVTDRLNILDEALNDHYSYDGLDRLTKWEEGSPLVTKETWTLDALGNNLSAGSYDASNEETPDSGSSGYDAAGNMITLQSGDTAIYDAWNRLTSVTGSPQAGEQVVSTYAYDGLGRRIRESVQSTTQDPPIASLSQQDDYYSGQQVVETRENSVVEYQFVWSPRYIDAPLLRNNYDGSGNFVRANRVFYLGDANYNVTGLLKYNPGTGTWQVAEAYSYAPYGVVTYRNTDWSTATSSANSNTVLYTGRTLDLSTGLYYYRARYYNPGIGEVYFHRSNRIFGGDVNLYRYCTNDPITCIDPTGAAKDPAKIVVQLHQRR